MSKKKFIFKKTFQPHGFLNKVVIKEMPKVLISQEVINDINIIINSVSTEIAFMMCITKQDNNYIIEEVFVPEQDVTGTTADISTLGLSKLTEDLLAMGDVGIEKFNKIRGWGHSHVHMEVNPSGTDEQMTNEFLKDNDDFFVRLICNQLGKMKFDVYDIRSGINVIDCEWSITQILPEDAQSKWTELISKNVKEKKYGGYVYGDHAYENEGFYPPYEKLPKPRKKDLTEQSDDDLMDEWRKKFKYGGTKI